MMIREEYSTKRQFHHLFLFTGTLVSRRAEAFGASPEDLPRQPGRRSLGKDLRVSAEPQQEGLHETLQRTGRTHSSKESRRGSSCRWSEESLRRKS